MSKRISQLRSANKAGNTSREYLLLSNIDSNTSTKIALNDVFPTLQSGKASGAVTTGSTTTNALDMFVGGGVGSSTANTDKSILIFKGLQVSDSTGALTLRNDVSQSDGAKQNLVIGLDQSNINLGTASNTSSKFLSEFGGSNPLNLGTSTHVAGTLPVDHGGSGVTTFTDGALVVGNGTDGLQTVGQMAKGSLVVGVAAGTNPTIVTTGSNGQVLTADSSVTGGLKWDTPVFKSTSFSAQLDTNSNDIKIGTGIIKGSTSGTSGIAINTASDYVFIGGNTRFYDTFLNVGGSITVGEYSGNTAQSIIARGCSSGASPAFTVKGSDNADNSSGGELVLQGGEGQTNGAGGNVRLTAGRKAGSGTEGSVILQTKGTTIFSIDGEGHSTFNDQVTFAASKGILTSTTGAVTQTASLTTNVTVNAFAGVITLYSGALSAAAEAEFTVGNSVVNANSMIMLTVQCGTAAIESDGATLCASLSSVGAGEFKIRLTNPGSAATGTSNKIHFFVVNLNA